MHITMIKQFLQLSFFLFLSSLCFMFRYSEPGYEPTILIACAGLWLFLDTIIRLTKFSTANMKKCFQYLLISIRIVFIYLVLQQIDLDSILKNPDIVRLAIDCAFIFLICASLWYWETFY